MTDDVRQRLLAGLADNARQQAELARQHAEIVAASEASNADDEHDPEGATIAFERQQVAALQQAVERSRLDLERALSLLGGEAYGTCEGCGGPIGAERLEARPTARQCVSCATRARRG